MANGREEENKADVEFKQAVREIRATDKPLREVQHPTQPSEDIMSMAVEDVSVGERGRLVCEQIKGTLSQIKAKLQPVLVPSAEPSIPPSDHSELLVYLTEIVAIATDIRDSIDI